MPYRFPLLVVAAAIATAPVLRAGHEYVDAKKQVIAESPFDKGKRELQIGVGAFFSLDTGSRTKPDVIDVDGAVRLGWMLTSPSGSGACSGNLEFLVEAFGAAIVDGPGSGMGGLTLLLRYNFVHGEARLVPYFQIGAGGLYNDLYDERPQRLLGQAFEWNLQGGLGLRYLCSDRLGCFIEADFRHISNANSADRNIGLNSIGGLLGVSYFF